MRPAWWDRTAGFLERAVGVVGAAAVLAAAAAVPYCASRTPGAGGSGERLEIPIVREVIRLEIVESWASEGFAEMAAAVAAMPAEPTWESVRSLMEEGGWTKLRYSVRLRWALNDGSSEVTTCNRRPYQREAFFEEFLHVLRNGLVEDESRPPQVLWSASDSAGPPGPFVDGLRDGEDRTAE